MDSARTWLDVGGFLEKSAVPDPEALRLRSPTKSLSDAAVAHLRAIQEEIAMQEPDPNHKELISIAIDDMKVVTTLMKLVVVYGLYPFLPDDSMILLKPRISWELPPKNVAQSTTTQFKHTTESLVSIALTKDDLASLILISPFLVDLLAASSFFECLFVQLVDKIPTFTLYKILIHLRSRPAPQPVIVRSLGELPVQRKDAVRTLIELVIEPKSHNSNQDVDLQNSDRAAQVLASIPSDVSKVAYIRALGRQLFELLAGSAGHKVADGAARVVAVLSDIQPRFVGELRNLLVRPFEATDTPPMTSLAAMLRLAQCTEALFSGLYTHVAARICPAVWLLVNTLTPDAKGELDDAYLVLLARILETNPEASMKSIILAFTASQLPGRRLAWSCLKPHQPILLETVGTLKSDENQGLLQVIDTRLDVLVSVMAKVSDPVATSILIFVLQWYINGSKTSDPMTSIVLAKTVERLAKDGELRPKLFSDPNQIVYLSFKLISANVTRTLTSEPPISSLNIADVDSDDEDIDTDDVTNDSGSKNSGVPDDESLALIELSLSLLGSALMESLGSSEESQPEISSDQSRLLQSLSHEYPKLVRSKAEFCLQLLDGRRREQKEVNMENNAEVLAAARSALQEPLVPSRAYGLYLFTKLVERHAVTLDLAMSAYLEELKDEDSYVYLNAIKGIETAARVGDTSRVLDLLLPAVDSEQASLDAVLRAREALVRIISPGAALRLSSQIVDTFLADLRASARDTRDIRFRLSSCSLLGIIISQYPHALSETQENDAADCALGILRFENAPEEEALRKSAVILALEIVNAVNEGAFAGGLAKKTLASLITEIETIMSNSNDAVLLDHCRAVMEAAKNNA